jgi:hypothetical protein
LEGAGGGSEAVGVCGSRGWESGEWGVGRLKVYPKPMFDFDERRRVGVDGVKRAYEIGMYGDDGRVRSGEWRRAFGVETQEAAVAQVNGGVQERPKKKVRKSEIENEVEGAELMTSRTMCRTKRGGEEREEDARSC